jgi:hypothetical protein
MSQASKDTRSAAEKARDTAGIIGSLKHEGYVPTPETEAIHPRSENRSGATRAQASATWLGSPATMRDRATPVFEVLAYDY